MVLPFNIELNDAAFIITDKKNLKTCGSSNYLKKFW